MAQAISIANYIIEHELENGRSLTTYKLHKLLYYTQVYSLKIDGVGAFEEQLQAWPNGPVVAEIFPLHKGMKFLFSPINKEKLTDVRVLRIVGMVLGALAISTPDALVFRSHQERPWSAHEENVVQRPIITQQSIMEGYTVVEDKIVPIREDKDMRVATNAQFLAALQKTDSKYAALFQRLANA